MELLVITSDDQRIFQSSLFFSEFLLPLPFIFISAYLPLAVPGDHMFIAILHHRRQTKKTTRALCQLEMDNLEVVINQKGFHGYCVPIKKLLFASKGNLQWEFYGGTNLLKPPIISDQLLHPCLRICYILNVTFIIGLL